MYATADSSERTKHTKKKNEPPKKTHQFGVDGERDRGLSRGCFRDRFRQPVLSHACDDKRSRSVRFCRSRALNEPKREKERNVLVIIILILIRVKEFETPKRTFENDDTPKRKKTKTTTKKKKKKTRLLPPHAHRDEHWWCFCPSVHEPGMGAHNPNIFFFFFFFEGLCVKEVLFLCVSLSQKEKVKDFFITTFFNTRR